jgi:hypothetical protein
MGWDGCLRPRKALGVDLVRERSRVQGSKSRSDDDHSNQVSIDSSDRHDHHHDSSVCAHTRYVNGFILITNVGVEGHD